MGVILGIYRAVRISGKVCNSVAPCRYWGMGKEGFYL